MRAAFLREHPLCGMSPAGESGCLARGITTEATELDHIKPRSQGGSIYSPMNLQALCFDCHTQKTREERRQGEGGSNLYR